LGGREREGGKEGRREEDGMSQADLRGEGGGKRREDD